MGISEIARTAYFQVRALEKILVTKGILGEGVLAKMVEEETSRQIEEARKARLESWDKLTQGKYVRIRELGKWGKRGTKEGFVVSKSIEPFNAICIRDRKTKIRCLSNYPNINIEIQDEKGDWVLI